jgi:hypothetical protein
VFSSSVSLTATTTIDKLHTFFVGVSRTGASQEGTQDEDVLEFLAPLHVNLGAVATLKGQDMVEAGRCYGVAAGMFDRLGNSAQAEHCRAMRSRLSRTSGTEDNKEGGGKGGGRVGGSGGGSVGGDAVQSGRAEALGKDTVPAAARFVQITEGVDSDDEM